MSSGAQIGQIPVKSNSTAIFTPNGKYALIGGENLTLWDVFSGQKLRTIVEGDAGAISVSADGRKVLTYHKSLVGQGYLSVYNILDGNKIAEWRVRGVVKSTALSPDGRYALSPFYMGSLVLWEVSTGRIITNYSGHPRYIQESQRFFFACFICWTGNMPSREVLTAP